MLLLTERRASPFSTNFQELPRYLFSVSLNETVTPSTEQGTGRVTPTIKALSSKAGVSFPKE